MTITLKESKDLVISAFDPSILETKFCALGSYKKSPLLPKTVQFTVNMLNLDALFALMELDNVINVFWHPQASPPQTHVNSIASRYRVYVEFDVDITD